MSANFWFATAKIQKYFEMCKKEADFLRFSVEREYFTTKILQI